MTVNDVADAIESIMKQNREELTKKGTKFSYQIEEHMRVKNMLLAFKKEE